MLADILARGNNANGTENFLILIIYDNQNGIQRWPDNKLIENSDLTAYQQTGKEEI
jgi:uncharacterized protein YehS (DUF1456 family)